MPEGDYVVYESQEAKPVVIRLLRFSETNFGKAGLISASFDGEISSVPEKALKLEFIGDSITCGYGVEADDPLVLFSTSTENPSLAYAMKTAELLDADYSLCSWSGNGIISQWIPPEENEPKEDVPLMPVVYRYTDIAGAAFQGFSEAPLYDFDSYVPDVVIINLGTNDQSYTRFIPERVEAFGRLFGKFLQEIRELRPNALIIGCLGVMGQDLCEEEARRFDMFNDDKAFFLTFDVQKEEDGIGADYHPSPKTHTIMAQKLAEFIRAHLN